MLITANVSQSCTTLHRSLIEVLKRSDAGSCHLARVHRDVPGAALSIVIAVGIVPAGEGAGLCRQLLRTTTPRSSPWKGRMLVTVTVYLEILATINSFYPAWTN